MLKWSSTPTLTPMRCHSLFCELLEAPILAQILASPPNEGVALPCAGGMVRLPPKQRPGRPRSPANSKVLHMAKVAFLGLGVMGFPMAGHLVKKGGHEVTVFNRTGAKAQAWAEKFGGATAPTPKAASQGQDFVMACVGNDNDLRAITVGPDGAFAGMKKGAVFVDHTTASAEVARELDAEASKLGFKFVDAPVSGGQAGAENGVLTV